MTPEDKTLALEHIDLALCASLKVAPEEEMRFGSISGPEIKQGLTLHEIREEIKKETPTGEVWAKVWKMQRPDV